MTNYPVWQPFEYKKDKQQMNTLTAGIAAITSVHECITRYCGGNKKGERCRFGYPKKLKKKTILSPVRVSSNATETLHARTNSRVGNVNKFHMLYWRGNMDGQPSINQSINSILAKVYILEYVTKSGDFEEVEDYALSKLVKRAEVEVAQNVWSVLFQLF
jgi:hypothetical protein